MPVREDILTPIPGDNPGGRNLRYAPVYDKIKEARRQDDDAVQGEWQRERKVADYLQVIKLANEAIATESKDLQLAAWLTEALLAREGYAGLRGGLTLIKDLVEQFWDHLYPELDEGDAEMRAAPVDWVGGYLTISCKRVALNKAGHDFLKYLEAKAVGYEPQYEDGEARKEAWQAAISENKLPLEEFDKSVNASSKEFYAALLDNLDGSLQIIEESQAPFEEKFGEFAPSYGKLRESLEEVRRLVNQFLQKKIDAEGPAPEPEPVEPDPEAPPDEEPQQDETPRPKKTARRFAGGEPADKDDAAARVAAVAAYLRREDPYSPAPYLMLRGLRWGELRTSGSGILDLNLFEPPPTETRQSLKRMLNDGQYAEALELAESAMAEPCGRAWLDLQRYVVTALEYQSYTAIAEAIKSELKALVRDFPDLSKSMMLDDTPVANPETVEWIKSFAAEPEAFAPPPVAYEAPMMDEPAEPVSAAGEPAPPDSFQLATEAARSGRSEDAIEILADEIGRQTSGRGRFQRKLQLAQICLSVGQDSIAHSLLEELASAIDRHQLEDWESADVVAHALSLLYSCIQRAEIDPAQKAKLYARICRLDPVQALKHSAHAFAHSR
jgi:type VI secretion system protein ImpA